MKKTVLSFGIVLCTLAAFSQTGTASSPFIALGQSRNVTTAGTYYFNLSGTAFSTYIAADGKVLIATDYGGAPSSNLPTTTGLSNVGRGILSSEVLAKLTNATTAIYTTSDGSVNTITTEPVLLSRIVSNKTLHQGLADISLNSTWTGTGSSYVTGANSSCTVNPVPTLSANIHHPCGDGLGFHWIPSIGYHRLASAFGETANSVQFNLWIQAPLVLLPVKLADFTAARQGSNSVLAWKVAQEENIATYIVERSADGRSFTQIGSVASLGNTSAARTYTFTDASILKGANYYRLKITEKNGKVNYSEVRLLNFGSQISIALYPNPAKNKATLTGVEAGHSIRLVDAVGKVLQVQQATGTTETVLLTGLSKGLYGVQVYGANGILLSTARFVKE